MAEPALSVLHVAAPAPVGGLERVVQAVAIGQHQRGTRVEVVAVVEPHETDHPFAVPLREAGVQVRMIAVAARAYLEERRQVRALCRSFQPDIVHTHGYRPDLLDAPVARKVGAGTVTTMHGSSRMGPRTNFYEWVELFALRHWLDGVICVSRPIVESLAGSRVPRDLLHLVPNAWVPRPSGLERQAARATLGLPAEGFVIAFVGRLIPAKGPDVFVEAMARLGDLPVTAVVIGDGFERRAVEERARPLTDTGRLRFLGHLDDAFPLFAAFDGLALTSRTEGTPIVLFEAMAAGVPVIATRVGGVPDVVSENEALLAPPENPDAVAAAVRALRADPTRARDRAARARVRLREAFGPETWLDRHEAVYRAARAHRYPAPGR